MRSFILAVIVALTLLPFCQLVNTTYSQPIPYEGLTLKWVSDTTIQIGEETNEETDTYLFKYTQQLSPMVFEAKRLSQEQISYQINATSRQILTGEYIGNFSTHFIPTDVSVGDIVTINVDDWLIVSTTEHVKLESIRDVTITCIKAEHIVPFLDDLESTLSMCFDKNTGLKVSFGIDVEGYSNGVYEKVVTKAVLVETDVDNDSDGLTDYQELFITLTNPLKADTDADGISDFEEDSDGDSIADGQELLRGTSFLDIDSDDDFWNDAIDFMPTSLIMPNLIIVAAITIIICVVIVWSFRRKKKQKED